MKNLLFFLFAIIISHSSFGQDIFENTMFLDSTKESPTATLDAASWIEGHWRGEAFGGIIEEIWSPPLGNSMMCVFKLVAENEVQFYEIVTISEENNTLILRLKHFNNNLTGWEEKDETVDFLLVKVEENRILFDGFTFERINENELNIYVVIADKEGQHEAKFAYKRYKHK